LEEAVLRDIVEVSPRGGYTLHLRFEDGVEGDVDIAEVVRFSGVFAALKDRLEFAKVLVDPESGTIRWPNGADIDPVVLYARVTGATIESILQEATQRAR
jgi:hypothetical protein